ncbi:MAG: PEP-CTERM sorting domain-containing protein [Pirellulales bacterium]
MKRLLTLTMALGLVVAAVGMAQANLLGNPGFETVPTGMAGDWTTFAGGPGGVSAQATLMPHSGTGHMDLQVGGANAFGGVFQQVPIAVNLGDTVTFTGWHKSLVDPFTGTRELKIEWNGQPQTRVDSLVIGTDYEQFSLVGIAPANTTGFTITYALSSFNAGAGENNVYIDDFDVTIARTGVPEPTSVMLGLMGLCGAAGMVRRRK